MKKSGFFAASFAAASAISSSSSSTSTTYTYNSNLQISNQESNSMKDEQITSSKEKFAPKFDGLRFIETLVTAHR